MWGLLTVFDWWIFLTALMIFVFMVMGNFYFLELLGLRSVRTSIPLAILIYAVLSIVLGMKAGVL